MEEPEGTTGEKTLHLKLTYRRTSSELPFSFHVQVYLVLSSGYYASATKSRRSISPQVLCVVWILVGVLFQIGFAILADT